MNFGFAPLASYIASVGAGDFTLQNRQDDQLSTHSGHSTTHNSISNPAIFQPPPPHRINSNFSTGITPDGSEISDWGIDEVPVSSRHTSISHRPEMALPLYPSGPTSYHKNDRYVSQMSHMSQISRIQDHHIVTTQEMLSFIKNYLSLKGKLSEFWEKFKYELVITNLLDDSMILSKNEQCLKELMSRMDKSNLERAHRVRVFSKSLNNDNVVLKITKQYSINYPKITFNNGMIVRCLLHTIELLRAQLSPQSPASIALKLHLPASRFHRFKILLILSTKVIQAKRLSRMVEMNQIHSKLEKFLLYNYKLNKKLMQSILRAKEYEMFLQGDTNKIGKDLDNSLSILIQTFWYNVKCLLPYMNGVIFEQYCSVNNVNLSSVLDQNSCSNQVNFCQELTRKLARFNQIRKLFVCQLLVLNEPVQSNFFTLKLFDDFAVDTNGNRDNLQMHNIATLASLLKKTNSIMKASDIFFENCTDLKHGELANQDVLQLLSNLKDSNTNPSETIVNDTDLLHIIDRLTTLTTNIKYFQKYNASTASVTDFDELNEKLFIFTKFSDEIDSIKEILQVSANDFENSINPTRSPSSLNNSSRRSLGNFNLKSFHTSLGNSHKKRFSLPPGISVPGLNTENKSTNKPLLSSPITLSSPSNLSRGTPDNKKYKRLSAGLPIGLLTVFEEPLKTKTSKPYGTPSARTTPKSVNPSISYDDNYINIMPSNTFMAESYNQATLDSLSTNNNDRSSSNNFNNNNDHLKKILGKEFSSRYSLNSMNSNVSGISEMIVSTEASTLDEYSKSNLRESLGTDNSVEQDGSILLPPISSEQLKLQLENKLRQMYDQATPMSLREEPMEAHNEEISTIVHKAEDSFLKNLDSMLALNQ